MTRCAAQDGFKQANGFLREAVAGKQVDVSERLRNESLWPVVKQRLARHSCQASLHFRRGFSLRAHPWSRWLRKFGLQKLLGYPRARRQEPHLSEHAVKLALCRIAVRLAVEKLFESLLGSFPLLLGNQGITQIRQRIGQPERIAGAAVQFHEPFERD